MRLNNSSLSILRLEFIGVVSCCAIVGLALTCVASSFAEDNPPPPPEEQPWWTGPLLAPAATTIAPGHINLEPYLFIGEVTGHYNNHWVLKTDVRTDTSINPQLLIQPGLTSFMDVKIFPQVFFKENDGATSYGFGDLPVRLGFQLLREDSQSWEPAIKLFLGEIFPTGSYQHLNPSKKGTDGMGGGSFVTSVQLLSQKTFLVYDDHFVRFRAFVDHGVAQSVHVEGLNTYGGASDTNAEVSPGDATTVILAFEYHLTRNWVIAMDMQYLYSTATTFTGNPGTTPSGDPAMLGKGVVDQWSLAPAIEYDFNANLGIIGGVWFSLAGKNSPDFITPTFALNYVY